MSTLQDVYAHLSPTTKATLLRDSVEAIQSRIAAEDWLAALRQAGNAAEHFSSLAGDIAQSAYNDGATKRAIADALGVPPSTFRGMVKS